MLCGFDGGAATMTTTMTATTMTMWLSNFLHPSVSHLSEWGIPGVCRVWTEMLNQIRQMKFEEIDDQVDYELLNCFNGWDRRLGEGIQRMGMGMCVLKSVWPDLAKFRHFRKKNLNPFWHSFEGLFSNWHNFEPYFWKWFCYWVNFHCCKWQNIKQIIQPSSHTGSYICEGKVIRNSQGAF